MSETIRKKFNGSTPFTFMEGEVFKPVNCHTFISNFGRVMSLNSTGYWKMLEPFKTKRGTLQVAIRDEYDYKGPLRNCKMLARLVLSAFVGGYYKQRVVKYLDGDKTNCTLENLEWEHGFQNGIDKKYLLSLKDHLLEPGDLVVKNVLLYEKEWELLQYLERKCNSYFYKILNEDFKMIVPMRQLLDEVYDRALDYLKRGRYIPLSIRSKKYRDIIKKNENDDNFLLFLRVRALDYLYHYQPPTRIYKDRVLGESVDIYSELERVDIETLDIDNMQHLYYH